MENKQAILQKLTSARQELVSEAIREIREGEDFSIIPELLEILLHAREACVVTGLTTLLADVKEVELKGLLVEKLVEAGEEEGRANLLRVCWESAMDFSEYLEVFAGLLLDGDFITSLEASTVIENLNGDIPAGTRERVIRQLEEAARVGDKAFLVEDALRHLAQWEGGE
jgi:hypothetical protein